MEPVLTIIPLILFSSIALLYWLQRHIVFRPHYYPNRSKIAEHSSDFRVEWFTTKDGSRLEGVVYEPASANQTLLYFGGRDQDSAAFVAKLALSYPDLRIIGFNYRGYGRSEGKAEESIVLEDALQLYDRYAEAYGPLNILGFSLGSSMAAYVGANRHPLHLFLVAPFRNLPELVRSHGRIMPGWLIRNRFDTYQCVQEIHAPLYVFGSKDDEIVPVEHVVSIIDAAPNLAGSKVLGGYNHDALITCDDIVHAIHEALMTREGEA